MLPSRLKYKSKAQILLTTLIILMVVSLTVLTITATTQRSARQTFANVEYDKSYNYAETRLIKALNEFADPEYDLANILVDGLAGSEKCEKDVGESYLCSYVEDDAVEGRRTILKISQTNYLENYDLAPGEYFNIVLSGAGSGNFNGVVDFKWAGVSAFDLQLTYQDTKGDLQVIHEIIDPTQSTSDPIYYDTGEASSGFLNKKIIQGSELKLDFSQDNLSNLPAGSKLKSLKIKAVNKTSGATISVYPETQSNNFPDQAQKLEAFSYNTNNAEAPAPVVTAQIPLSPPVPEILSSSVSSGTLISPFCGNGVREGAEYCDDANNIDNDGCPNICRCEDGEDNFRFDTPSWHEHEDFSVYPSDPAKLCAFSDDMQYEFGDDSSLDDILVMIRPEDEIIYYPGQTSFGAGMIYEIPEVHLMIAPTYGALDQLPKKFMIEQHPWSIYEFDGNHQGNIGGFLHYGYNTSTFEDDITAERLKEVGFDYDGKLIKFKFVHIVAGSGFAHVNLKLKPRK
jgi:cysteine-rich repeat protein